jgi:Na+-transporting NADH:ubiquinone oxidoreductase subunit NqrB
MFFTPLLKDARYFQIIFQCVFLTYGIFYLGWNVEWWLYTTYVATSLLTQLFFETIRSFIKNNQLPLWIKITGGLPSAIISAMGLCLLLKTNTVAVAALAAFISIASKYIIRINGKHIFNPSALAIVVTVFITQNAWISPGQWGSGAVILFAVFCLGFIITTKVQKLDVSLAFLFSFGGLLFVRQILYLGWPMDYFVQSISTGSVLLFCFFMISDPKTTPNQQFARITWSIAAAAVSFYLTAFKFMNGAPILVLVCSQPIVPLLDKWFKAASFQWQSTNAVSKPPVLNTYNHLSL